MHSHLLPGIDDGSPDLSTSFELIKGLQALGFEKLITTPHIFLDYYPNTSSIIQNGVKSLIKALRKEKITVEIEAAAEYYTDRHFDGLLNKNDILCFSSQRYVLIEMSFISATPNIEAVIFNLITKGYQPILAHPERYPYWHHNQKVYDHLRSLGCLMQLNILSLMGYYGHSVEKQALAMVKAHQIDFLGTDLHHRNHLDALKSIQFDKSLNALFEKYTFQNINLLR